jgi:exodeoxyribonuclease V beta subunit
MASLTDDLAEAVRLTYVALTRAESACFVHLVKENGFEFSSLSSLAEGFDVVRGRLLDKLSMSNSNFKRAHDSSSFRMVEELTELESHDSIHFRVAKSDRSVLNSDSTSEAEHFSVLTFSRNDLNDYPTVSSFSALSASADTISFEEMKPGFDYDETEQSTTSEEDMTPNRFNLKKGAETGTMLHNIFESIQFHDPESISPAVKDQLEWLGLDQEWNDIVSEIITDTINHDLGNGISLKGLKPKNYFPEIEFHLPTQKISFGELINTIRGRSPQDPGVSTHGFLKGYIDLTFKAGGRYYILDYKSNHLGDSFKDYSDEALTGEVEHAGYDLQYHIYTVALHRMLRQSLPNYEYETHFGGVFYVFIRGVQSGVPGSGVFFHKPEAKVISSLDLLFDGREK